MAALLALLTAVSWGTTDFLAGFVTKRNKESAVTFWRLLITLPITSLLALVTPGSFYMDDALFVIAAGVCCMFALLTLSRGLAIGNMGIVAPIAGVVSAGVPVLYGVATDEKLSVIQFAGIALALIGIVFMSISTEKDSKSSEAGDRENRLGTLLGFAAGLFFAAQFILLHHTHDDAGLKALPLFFLIQVVLLGLFFIVVRQKPIIEPSSRKLVILIAFIDPSGTGLFLLANQVGGMLSAVSVLSSLYPAVTVLLAHKFLRERFGHHHRLGLISILTGLVCLNL